MKYLKTFESYSEYYDDYIMYKEEIRDDLEKQVFEKYIEDIYSESRLSLDESIQSALDSYACNLITGEMIDTSIYERYSLTFYEVFVLKLYLYDSAYINGLLLDKEYDDPLIKLMDRTLEKIGYKKYDKLIRNSSNKKYKNKEVGDVIEYDTYISTSKDFNIMVAKSNLRNDNNIELIIHNADAVVVKDLSDYPEENEHIINRNSKFKIINISDDKKIIELEYMK